MPTLTEQINEKKLKFVFTDEKPREWCRDEHYILLKCPRCKKWWWEGYGDHTLGFYITKNHAMWELCKHMVMHLVTSIRFNADVPHIDLFMDLIGKEKGKELLKKYAAKSIIVARNIRLYLKKLREMEKGR